MINILNRSDFELTKGLPNLTLTYELFVVYILYFGNISHGCNVNRQHVVWLGWIWNGEGYQAYYPDIGYFDLGNCLKLARDVTNQKPWYPVSILKMRKVPYKPKTSNVPCMHNMNYSQIIKSHRPNKCVRKWCAPIAHWCPIYSVCCKPPSYHYTALWFVHHLHCDVIESLVCVMTWYFGCLNDMLHGPLTRYVKLRVAHAPGMSGTIYPPPTSKETAS